MRDDPAKEAYEVSRESGKSRPWIPDFSGMTGDGIPGTLH